MKRLLLVTSLLIAVQTLNAQNTSQEGQGVILTFEEAVNIGLKNNVLLNTQKNNLYVSEARKAQAFAQFLPSLNAQAQAQRGNGLTIDPTTGVGSNITSDNVYAALNAN